MVQVRLKILGMILGGEVIVQRHSTMQQIVQCMPSGLKTMKLCTIRCTGWYKLPSYGCSYGDQNQNLLMGNHSLPFQSESSSCLSPVGSGRVSKAEYPCGKIGIARGFTSMEESKMMASFIHSNVWRHGRCQWHFGVMVQWMATQVGVRTLYVPIAANNNHANATRWTRRSSWTRKRQNFKWDAPSQLARYEDTLLSAPCWSKCTQKQQIFQDLPNPSVDITTPKVSVIRPNHITANTVVFTL